MEKLYGSDYLTRPYLELRSHPDFSDEAYHIIMQVAGLDTEHILQIIIVKEN